MDNNTNTTAEVTAVISVQDFGDIKLELYPDIAPQSVYNFVYLARQGFYDGLIFHRISKGFVIQGGGYTPDGTRRETDSYTIFGEFEANGFKNPLKHERGVISWARTNVYNSATSQFFICLGDAPHLDGNYAGFGRVTEGMDVVDKIASVSVQGETPLQDVIIKTVTINGPELPEPDFLR